MGSPACEGPLPPLPPPACLHWVLWPSTEGRGPPSAYVLTSIDISSHQVKGCASCRSCNPAPYIIAAVDSVSFSVLPWHHLLPGCRLSKHHPLPYLRRHACECPSQLGGKSRGSVGSETPHGHLVNHQVPQRVARTLVAGAPVIRRRLKVVRPEEQTAILRGRKMELFNNHHAFVTTYGEEVAVIQLMILERR